MQSPLLGKMLTSLHEPRTLSNLLTDAALRAHVRGNDAAALEFIWDTRHISYTVEHQPSIVGHLVAIGIEAMARTACK